MKQLNRNEKQVMDLLWRSPCPLTSLELSEQLGEAMSVSYLHKVLTTLKERGLIGVCGVDLEPRRPTRQFAPLVTKEDYVSALIAEQGLEEASLAQIGVALVRKAAKDGERKELIAALEKMIEEYKREEM